MDAERVLDFSGRAALARRNMHNEMQIGNYQVSATISDIPERLDISQEEQARYLYMHFHFIARNYVIPSQIRTELLDEILKKLIDPYRKSASVYGLTLQNIYRYYVLENENREDREMLNNRIVFHLFSYRYSKKDEYIACIAQVFRALYFYSNYETETLTEQFRQELRTMFTNYAPTKNKMHITLNALINVQMNEILNWLIKDACVAYKDDKHLFSFDYFPSTNYISKKLVWSQSALLWFAFEFYCTAHSFTLFPIEKALQETNTPESIQRRIYCDLLMLSNRQSNLLNDEAKENIE